MFRFSFKPQFHDGAYESRSSDDHVSQIGGGYIHPQLKKQEGYLKEGLDQAGS
jgi:hypothetical protein